MKLNFAICSIVGRMVAATLWKNLRPPMPYWSNGSDSFAFSETKNCRQHTLLVLRLMLVT